MHKRYRLSRKVIITASASLVSICLVILAVKLLMPKPVVPPAIKRQLTSALIVPAAKGITIDRTGTTYDKSEKVLHLIYDNNGSKLFINEQPTPDEFVDIPDAYTKFVEALGEYNTFDSSYGTVHLVKSTKTANKQVAVATSQGTLVFITSDKDMSEDAWRQLFLQLKVIH